MVRLGRLQNCKTRATETRTAAATQGRGGDGVPPGRKLRSRCAARVLTAACTAPTVSA
jgi:hypothetical protein